MSDEALFVNDIIEATRDRIRPIFMSTLTSIFGMIPLVVFPGADFGSVGEKSFQKK